MVQGSVVHPSIDDAMNSVFLSYTYRPHPDHEQELERLRRYVVRVLEAMDLRIADGVDLGGRPLDDALRQRIRDADALGPEGLDTGLISALMQNTDNE